MMFDPSNFLIATTLFDWATWITQNMVNLLLQSTALITLGFVAALACRPLGSAVQSAIYRATMVAVLCCPFASIAINSFGIGGWTIRLPQPNAMMVDFRSDPVEMNLPRSSSTPLGEMQFDGVNGELEAENIVNGRIINLEGNPIVGAKVEVTYVDSLGNDLADRWLAKLEQTKDYGESNSPKRQPALPQMSWISGAYQRTVKTNERGEFQCRGLPLDSIVIFQVSHREVTTQLFQILNRSMETVDADPHFRVLGDSPLVVTQPCRPIKGTVVDSKTGDPIEGVKIYSQRMGIPSTVYGLGAAPRTNTDAQGKFELLGMPKSTGNRLMIYPPADQPYLMQEVNQIPDTEGLQAAELNIKLERGVWISGKVIDKQTGRGVKSGLRYFPVADNLNYLAARGFQTSSRNDHYTFFDNYQTNVDGTFRVIGLPGRAVFGATVESQDYRPGVGYQQVVAAIGKTYSAEQIAVAKKSNVDLSGRTYR